MLVVSRERQGVSREILEIGHLPEVRGAIFSPSEGGERWGSPAEGGEGGLLWRRSDREAVQEAGQDSIEHLRLLQTREMGGTGDDHGFVMT